MGMSKPQKNSINSDFMQAKKFKEDNDDSVNSYSKWKCSKCDCHNINSSECWSCGENVSNNLELINMASKGTKSDLKKE